jgi:mRNA interferase RelE/StbE
MLRVEFTKAAEKGLGNIEKHIAQRILEKIHWLAENSDYINHKPLSAQFAGTYKLRVGEYRAIYTIEKDDTDFLLIHLVGHRREIYKSK